MTHPTPTSIPERLLDDGPRALTDVELLAVVLRNGRDWPRALCVAQGLLDASGGLPRLVRADAAELRRHALDTARVAIYLAAVELGVRLARARLVRGALLHRQVEIARYLTRRYPFVDQEILGALFLDVDYRLIAEMEIFRGALGRALVQPRQVLRHALMRGAARLVLFHTHPGDDPTPSEDDLAFTRLVRAAGEILDVQVLDHLVLGAAGRWCSMVHPRGVEDEP